MQARKEFNYVDNDISQAEKMQSQIESRTTFENLANADIKLHEGQLSYKYGFVPHMKLPESLPKKYRALDLLSLKLPQLIAEGNECKEIDNLPLLEANDVRDLPNEYLARAATILCNFINAYVLNKKSFDESLVYKEVILPKTLTIPFQQICDRLGRDAMTVSIFDGFLCNWKLKNPAMSIDNVTMDDLDVLVPMFGSEEERIFNLATLMMELKFAPAIDKIISSIESVKDKDDNLLIQNLTEIELILLKVSKEIENINMNSNNKNYVDPIVWSKTLARFGEPISKGKAGVNGAAFPLFHLMDVFIERHVFRSEMGKSFLEQGEHLPRSHSKFFISLSNDLEKYSLHTYILESENLILIKKYRAIINTYAGILEKHARKVYGFVKLKFRSGKLATNGELERDSAIAIEPASYIQNKFDGSSIERGMQKWQQYENVTKFSDMQLSPNAVEIVLDAGGMYFEPGDKLCLFPQNNDHEISRIIPLLNYTESTIVTLNDTWKDYLKNNWKIDKAELSIRKFLKYCDLRNASDLLLNYCNNRLVNKMAQSVKINRRLHYTVSNIICHIRQNIGDELKFSCNVTANDYIGAMLMPIQSRTYSVSPMYDCVLQKNLIRLVIGRHAFHDGVNTYCGLSSDYLINLKSGDSLRIRKLFYQNFLIPQDNNIPIIMFAAGTGISPFLGFIDMLNKSSEKRDMYLFLSVQNERYIYYKEIIEQAILEKGLKFSVILSKEHKKAYVWEPKDLSNSYKYLTTSSNHIDEIINDKKMVLKNLLEKDAHVYVCGSIGFAETVSAAINDINIQNFLAPNNYVSKLIANNKYHVEVFSPTVNYDETKVKYPISEVLRHTSPNDSWIIINNKVYNVSEFMNIHPGGNKIIKINAGLDATFDYAKIGHNESQQINAMLLQYFVGHLKRPKLISEYEQKVFNKWLEFISALTEMSNNLDNNLEVKNSTLRSYLTKNIYQDLMEGSFHHVFRVHLPLLYKIVTDLDCNIYNTTMIENYVLAHEPNQIIDEVKELIDNIKIQALQGLIELEKRDYLYDKKILSDIINNILELVNSYLESKYPKVLNIQAEDNTTSRMLHQFNNISQRRNNYDVQPLQCPFYRNLSPQ